MKWYLKVLGQWADFKTRASRQEFWIFVLFNVAFVFVTQVIDGFLPIVIFQLGKQTYGPVYLLYNLMAFVPLLAVQVRRFHDVGRTGWWVALFVGLGLAIPFTVSKEAVEDDLNVSSLLFSLAFLAVAIWVIVKLATKGQRGPNKWGANPNEAPEVKMA